MILGDKINKNRENLSAVVYGKCTTTNYLVTVLMFYFAEFMLQEGLTYFSLFTHKILSKESPPAKRNLSRQGGYPSPGQGGIPWPGLGYPLGRTWDQRPGKEPGTGVPQGVD